MIHMQNCSVQKSLLVYDSKWLDIFAFNLGFQWKELSKIQYSTNSV